MRKSSFTLMLVMLLTVILSFNGAVTYAATEVTADFDASTVSLILSGNASGLATLVVTTDDTSLVDSGGTMVIQGLTLDKIKDFEQFTATGSFTNRTLDLDVGLPVGKYKLYIKGDDGIAQDKFILYTKSDADTVVASLVSKIDAAAFANEVNSAAVAIKLGMDVDDPSHSNNTADIMFRAYGNTYTDSDDFKSTYALCAVIDSLKNKSRAQIETIMDANDTALGLDYAADYRDNTAFTTDVKDFVCQNLSTMDYPTQKSSAELITGDAGIKAVINGYAALSALENVGDWLGIKEVYDNANFAFLASNVIGANSDFSKKDSTAVYQNMVGMSFDDISDLKSNFDTAVASTPNKETPPTTVYPPTFGGGGGGGGTIVAPPAVNDDNEEIPPASTETTPGSGSSAQIGGYVPTLKSGTNTFQDVAQGSWYEASVASLAATEIVSGDSVGLFRPANNITRAEYTKLIVAAFSVTGPGKSFDDVSESDWYYEYVSKASGAGIISGYDGKFNPQNNITRQDAIVILDRAANLCKAGYTGFKAFDDMNDVSLYAWNAVGTFYYNGIISGKDGKNFDPKATLTRAEAAQMIYNFIQDMSNR